MKGKKIIFAIVLYLLGSLVFFTLGFQEAIWKGMIEKVDGVTIVKNPKKPMLGDDVCVQGVIEISNFLTLLTSLIYKGNE